MSLCIRPYIVDMYEKIKSKQLFVSKAEVYTRAIDIGMRTILQNIEQPYDQEIAEANGRALDVLKELSLLLRENLDAMGRDAILRSKSEEEAAQKTTAQAIFESTRDKDVRDLGE